MLLDRGLSFDGCEQKEQGKMYYTRQIYLCITGPLCREPTVTHGPHIGPELGKTFISNDVIMCTACDPLSVQDDKNTIDFRMEV